MKQTNTEQIEELKQKLAELSLHSNNSELCLNYLKEIKRLEREDLINKYWKDKNDKFKV